jgi:hypothetical protein
MGRLLLYIPKPFVSERRWEGRRGSCTHLVPMYLSPQSQASWGHDAGIPGGRGTQQLFRLLGRGVVRAAHEKRRGTGPIGTFTCFLQPGMVAGGVVVPSPKMSQVRMQGTSAWVR